MSRLKLARRAGWTVADQVLSSLSNLVLSIVVAHALNALAFGAFSIAFLIFGIALAIERAIVGQPLQIKHSGDSPLEYRRALRRALSTALVIGLLFGAGCLVAGLVTQNELSQALISVAIFMPGLVLQDACRMAWFAVSDAREATILDLVWNVLLAVVLIVLAITNGDSLITFMLAWGGSATISAVIGFQRLRAWPSLAVSQAWAWVTAQQRLVGYLMAEYFIGLGAVQLSILVTGFLAGAKEVGSLRAAQVILGPLMILGAAAFSFAIPELTRRAHLTASARLKAGALSSAVLFLAAVTYLALALLVPDDLGRQLFGETWAGARAVLLPMGLASAASALGNGPGMVLYSLGRADLTFRLHATKLPFLLISVTIGAQRAGALGAAVALMACEAAMVPAWIWTSYRAARRPPPGRHHVDPSPKVTPPAPAEQGSHRA